MVFLIHTGIQNVPFVLCVIQTGSVMGWIPKLIWNCYIHSAAASHTQFSNSLPTLRCNTLCLKEFWYTGCLFEISGLSYGYYFRDMLETWRLHGGGWRLPEIGAYPYKTGALLSAGSANVSSLQSVQRGSVERQVSCLIGTDGWLNCAVQFNRSDRYRTEFSDGQSCSVCEMVQTLCYVVSRHVTSRHVTSCHVMSCHVMSCHVMSCHVMSCHVMLCHVMLCYVMLCYVMLCYVMLCYVMLYIFMIEKNYRPVT